jgi:hypothetical protein
MDTFAIKDEISPVEYAKLQKTKRKRARNKPDNETSKSEPEW